ncbi:hypothetical protein MRX96_036776 [Rhipicephalus microplus]
MRRCCVSPPSTCASSAALELDRVVRVCVTASYVSTAEPLGAVPWSCPPVVSFYSFHPSNDSITCDARETFGSASECPSRPVLLRVLKETLLAASWSALDLISATSSWALLTFVKKLFRGATAHRFGVVRES